MSLVEVMVATVIFTFIAASLVSLFIQNNRLARAITLRTVVTTTAIGVAEQIRAYPYSEYSKSHDNPSTNTLQIEFFDPTDAAAKNGMRVVNLPVNVADGVPAGPQDWTYVTTPLILTEDGATTKVPVNMRFWIDSQIRQPTIKTDKNGKQLIVTRCQLYEIALIYQWKNPNYSDSKWHSGVIRIITPNQDMNIPATPVSGS